MCHFLYQQAAELFVSANTTRGNFQRRDEKCYRVVVFFFFYLCLIVSPFYTTLFILCPFDIASCLLELCEEAGWLHAVTGTSSQSLVY